MSRQPGLTWRNCGKLAGKLELETKTVQFVSHVLVITAVAWIGQIDGRLLCEKAVFGDPRNSA